MTVPYDTMSTTSDSTNSLFNKCCCCIPLRIGCFILGYLSLFFNTFHTLALVAATLYVGISSHGFDQFDDDQERGPNQMPDVETIQKPFLSQVEILLIFVVCAKIAWLIINISCLVGLHKRNPGPIRVYVCFASVRLLLTLIGFIYLVAHPDAGSEWTTQSIITHSLDLGLSAYFILVYYIYAGQLDRERQQDRFLNQAAETPQKDISFIYPTKLDQKHLIA